MNFRSVFIVVFSFMLFLPSCKSPRREDSQTKDLGYYSLLGPIYSLDNKSMTIAFCSGSVGDRAEDRFKQLRTDVGAALSTGASIAGLAQAHSCEFLIMENSGPRFLDANQKVIFMSKLENQALIECRRQKIPGCRTEVITAEVNAIFNEAWKSMREKFVLIYRDAIRTVHSEMNYAPSAPNP